MIKVSLIGADVDKEKNLLESQSGIALQRIPIASLDEMLNETAIDTSDSLMSNEKVWLP